MYLTKAESAPKSETNETNDTDKPKATEEGSSLSEPESEAELAQPTDRSSATESEGKAEAGKGSVGGCSSPEGSRRSSLGDVTVVVMVS
jgi:hypothetical protein